MTWQLDATAQAALLDAREVTPLALLDQVLTRLDATEPVLNAFCHVDRDGARVAAEAATARQAAGARLGPLDGIPVSVKDNIFVKGMPARWGSLLYRDHVPDRDDITVERLRAAGAVIIGKTTTPEFALMGRTHSRLSGVTRNPWDPGLTPGGSSGGSVASVAAGVTALSLGTDMGGSTRLPASYTGLVGMRPSTGRLPRRYGFPPTAIDFQAICPFARTVRDTRLLYDVLAGPDRRDPYSVRFAPAPEAGRPLRIGWFTAIGSEGATPEVAATIAGAVRTLSGAGCDARPVAAPYDLAGLREIMGVLTAAAAARIVAKFPRPLARGNHRDRPCHRRTRLRPDRAGLCRRAGRAAGLALRPDRRVGRLRRPGAARRRRPRLACGGRRAPRPDQRDARHVRRLGQRRRPVRHQRPRRAASGRPPDRRADRRPVRPRLGGAGGRRAAGGGSTVGGPLAGDGGCGIGDGRDRAVRAPPPFEAGFVMSGDLRD